MPKMPKKKKIDYSRCGISWKTIKVGKYPYPGTYTGAKSNTCRASKAYRPKRFRTFAEDGKVYIERLPDAKS